MSQVVQFGSRQVLVPAVGQGIKDVADSIAALVAADGDTVSKSQLAPLLSELSRLADQLIPDQG